jgi:hypothetical protein
MFMTGAFDSLVSFATDAGGLTAAQHYSHCVMDAHMSNSQLATNILNYAKDRPALHTKPATNAMLDYLIAACGLHPPAEAKVTNSRKGRQRRRGHVLNESCGGCTSE